MKNHYVYLLLGDDGRYYYGVRSCSCAPAEDQYMGSFSDQAFQPKRKRILSVWDSREEAVAEEIRIHSMRNVAVNPRYANKAKQTSTRFDTAGTSLSEEARIKISQGSKRAWAGRDDRREERAKFLAEWNKSEDHKSRIRAELNPALRPEVKQKLREANLGERNPHYGRPTSQKQKETASATHRNKPKSESQRSKMAKSAQGRRLITNGEIRKWLKAGEELPAGWRYTKG